MAAIAVAFPALFAFRFWHPESGKLMLAVVATMGLLLTPAIWCGYFIVAAIGKRMWKAWRSL